jgi:8-oxo-dGTP pyrophosphatase MutT (NUDIX family)
MVFYIQNNVIYWLMSKRKDSIALICLLKNASKMKFHTFWFYTTKMTPFEIFLLHHYHTDDLIRELSIRKNGNYLRRMHDNISYMKQQYERAQYKFSGMNETWEFPKGRKQERETYLDAALRELREETSIPLDLIGRPVCEFSDEYMGLNNLMYGTKLFVMESRSVYRARYQFTNVIRLPSVSNEVSFTKWVSENDVVNNSCKTIYRKIIMSVGMFIRAKMKYRFVTMGSPISPIGETNVATERPIDSRPRMAVLGTSRGVV